MQNEEVNIPRALELLARVHEEVKRQSGIADPMQQLAAAAEWEDLDPFTCALDDLVMFMNNAADDFTRGLAAGVALARQNLLISEQLARSLQPHPEPDVS